MTKTIVLSKLRRVTSKIVNEFKPEKIMLFGSWAWGKPNAYSDVDILVVKNTANTRHTARKIDASLFPREFPMDILVYSPNQISRLKNKDFFVRAILNKGLFLYEKSKGI